MRIYSEESFDAVNHDTEKVDRRKIKIECPNCKRKFAALCSSKTRLAGASNQGCPEFDDWVSVHTTECGKCTHKFRFAVGE